MKKEDVVVLDIVRTPWGKPGGRLEQFLSSDLAASALAKLLGCTGVAPELVGQVIFGQAHPSTMPNNIGHYAWLKAELPVEIPGYTVQSTAASALQAVRSAYYLIASGNEQICVAGGADSYSAAPFVMRNVRNHFYPEDRLIIDTLDEAECCTQPAPMSRLEQHQRVYGTEGGTGDSLFAARSREKASAFTQLCGERLVSMSYIDRKKGKIVISQDEWLGVEREDNSPLAPYADGAAAVMLMSRGKAEELGVSPLGQLLGFSVAGGDLVDRQKAGTVAAKKLLQRLGLTMEDISIVEVLENSAADVLGIVSDLGGRAEVNPLGGAMAYGLNDGAEGIAMLQRVLASLKKRELGLLCIYSAGGQGMAAVVKKE